MKKDESRLGREDGRVFFDWEAFMKSLLNGSGEREKIGPAWLLFFDIARNADQSGMWVNAYSEMAKRYGVATITIKKWRHYLCQNSVIETYSQGHLIAFRLLEPYLDFLKTASQSIPCNEENEEIKALRTLKRLLSTTVESGTLKAA